MKGQASWFGGAESFQPAQICGAAWKGCATNYKNLWVRIRGI